jgi:hypothetical protein
MRRQRNRHAARIRAALASRIAPRYFPMQKLDNRRNQLITRWLHIWRSLGRHPGDIRPVYHFGNKADIVDSFVALISSIRECAPDVCTTLEENR